nr:RNA polymerase II subunit [Cryptomonas sp.]
MELVRESFIIREIDMVPLDPEHPSIKTKNKMFSKVSRIFAHSRSNLLEIILDINTEIYAVCLNDEIDVLITKVPQIENEIAKNVNDWTSYFGKEILDLYEYVVYGTVFHSGLEKNKFFVYASFGGLLLKLFGILKNNRMEDFAIDSKILLLIRKV